MQIYRKLNADGNTLSFEIETFPIGRRGVYRCIKSIEGVTLKKSPIPIISSLMSEEDFCVFELGGEEFTALEMFGGSDTYHIGPSSAVYHPQFEAVCLAFERL